MQYNKSAEKLHTKKYVEIMASIYSGRWNKKWSSYCHAEKTLCGIAKLIKKVWNCQFCEMKYNFTW